MSVYTTNVVSVGTHGDYPLRTDSDLSLYNTPLPIFAASSQNDTLSVKIGSAELSIPILEVREVIYKGINNALADNFRRISQSTGKAVQLLPDYGNVLALIGNDSKPVLLYELVEQIDGIVDYTQLVEAFPSLSFGQISSALSFLRKVAQFNTKGVDIDAVEDLIFEQSEDFKETVIENASYPEVTRVLNP